MDAVDRRIIRACGRTAGRPLRQLSRLDLGPASRTRVNLEAAPGVFTDLSATILAPPPWGWASPLISIKLGHTDHEEVNTGCRARARIEDCWFIASDGSYAQERDDIGGRPGADHPPALRGRHRTRTTIVLSTEVETRSAKSGGHQA